MHKQIVKSTEETGESLAVFYRTVTNVYVTRVLAEEGLKVEIFLRVFEIRGAWRDEQFHGKEGD